jgi:hypothetical protein
LNERKAILMGDYIVNGEVISVQEPRPTAQDLKVRVGAQPADWVMAALRSGKVLQLGNDELLPAEALDYSIVAPFTYGFHRIPRDAT